MSSLNQVSIIGHVGRKPELRHAASGGAVALFSVATNDVWTDKEGARRERTEWHRIVAWRGLADTVAEHLDGGRQVHVQGVLRTRDWIDATGSKRSITEVHATRVLFLGRRSRAEDVAEPHPSLDETEEIPF